jgi:hypothetical protein
MRMNFHLTFLLFVSAAFVSALFVFQDFRQEKLRRGQELERRDAAILGKNLEENVEPLLGERASLNIQGIVERFGNLEWLRGVAAYDANDHPLDGGTPEGECP